MIMTTFLSLSSSANPQKKYKYKLRYPMLPCVAMAGKHCSVPMELCTFLPGQRKARLSRSSPRRSLAACRLFLRLCAHYAGLCIR